LLTRLQTFGFAAQISMPIFFCINNQKKKKKKKKKKGISWTTG